MTAPSTDHALLIDGDRVETGEWTEVRSPYSGDVVGRVAKGGAADARRALDAAARTLNAPAQPLEERKAEAAGLLRPDAGKPMKAGRVEAQRAVSTYTFAAV